MGGSTPSKTKPEYYTNNGIAWITPKDLSINKSKFISHGENDITELGLKNSSATVMPKGTVLFSSRAPIGYIAIASDEVTTNQGFKSVVPYSEIGTAFVYFFLKHSLPVIESAASGSTFKEISGSAMKNIPAIIPDRSALDQFNSFCAPIFAQQKILEDQNHSLAMLRDAFNDLVPKIKAADCIVFASPLYFWTFSSRLKAFIERLYCIAEEDSNSPLGRYEKYPVKDCALLMTSADDFFWTFEQAVSYYQFALINYIGFHDKGMVLAGGCGDTNGRPQIRAESLQKAYEFGRTIYKE